MAKITDIQKLKAYKDGIDEEITMLDAEIQRRFSNIKIYLKEIDLLKL